MTRGAAWPDYHYRQVATMYKWALENGVAPQREIGKLWKVQPHVAADYVRRARALGFLGASDRASRGGLRCQPVACAPGPGERKKLKVTLDVEMYDALGRESCRMGVSMSAVIRSALRSYLP